MRGFCRTAVRGTALAMVVMVLAWLGPVTVPSDAAGMVKQGDKIEKAYAGLVLIDTQKADAQTVCGPDANAGEVYQKAYGPAGADFDHATVLTYGYTAIPHPLAAYFYAGQSKDEIAYAVALADGEGTVDIVYSGDPRAFPNPCGAVTR